MSKDEERGACPSAVLVKRWASHFVGLFVSLLGRLKLDVSVIVGRSLLACFTDRASPPSISFSILRRAWTPVAFNNELNT